MKATVYALILFAFFAQPGNASRRRATGPGLDVRRILWIGAHPDDEILIAPLLGRFCVEGTSRCSLLVLTRGEAGPCALPGGCGSDLGALRDHEMQAAAARFRATATQWGFPDAMDDVESRWDSAAGGRAAILERVRSIVEAEDPTLIVTFDPAHGTTCHPAHRHLGSLVVEAIGRERLVFVETAAASDGAGYRFWDALPSRSSSFDVVRFWSYLVEDAMVHASQFSADQVTALAATPDEQKIIWLVPAIAAEGAYGAVCP